MEKIVGSYNPINGKIYNPIFNLKKGIFDDYNTLIHELQHANFQTFSVFGAVIRMLEIEFICTPDEHKEHKERMHQLIDILCEAFRVLQEIYANSMELLWIEEYQGREQAKEVYRRKTEKYQGFSTYFKKILNFQGDPSHKRRIVHTLCIKAAAPDLTPEEFVKLLSDVSALEAYFAGEGNLENRLQNIISIFQTEPSKIEKISFINVEELLTVMLENSLLLYGKPYFQEMLLKDVMDEKELKQWLLGNYQDYLIEKTEVFSFDFYTNQSLAWHKKWEERYCCIRKKSPNLFQAENYMILGKTKKGMYIRKEVEKEEAEQIMEQSEAILIPFEEFSKQKNYPQYLQGNHGPLLVVITGYEQCEEWIELILDEDLYIVDTFQKEIPNFYTLLFFRRRTEPGLIFVYPTMKRLAEKLIDKFDLQEKVMYSDEQESIKMFSAFSDELQILHMIVWLFSFLCGTTWSSKEEDAASMLGGRFLACAADSGLQIRNSGYWSYKSALPTEYTDSVGFYTLMEFINGYNTGLICATEQNGKNYPIFFRDKQSALQYKNQTGGYQNYKVVGVDKYYWETLSEFLEYGGLKWVLFLEREMGIELQTEAFWPLIRKLQ